MIEQERFRIEDPSEPGRVIRGRVTRPAAAEVGAPLPWVLVLHGFKGFMDWGFFPWLSRRLAENGMAAVAFNSSGSGIGDDLHTFSDLEAFRMGSLSRQLEDVERVRRSALRGELGELDPDRVGLFGHSRGGGVALVHAAESQACRAVVTWAAVDSFDRWSAEAKRDWRLTGTLIVVNARTGQELPIDVEVLHDLERNASRFDVVQACGRVACPVLLLHGEQDDVVPASALERLARALPPPHASAVRLAGAGHTFGAVHPLVDVPAPLEHAARQTIAWLAERLEVTLGGGMSVPPGSSDRT